MIFQTSIFRVPAVDFLRVYIFPKNCVTTVTTLPLHPTIFLRGSQSHPPRYRGFIPGVRAETVRILDISVGVGDQLGGKTNKDDILRTTAAGVV